MINPSNSKWLRELLYESGSREKLNVGHILADSYQHPIFLDDRVGYQKLYSWSALSAFFAIWLLVFLYIATLFVLGLTENIYVELAATILLSPLILVSIVYIVAKSRTRYRVKNNLVEFRWYPNIEEFKDLLLEKSFNLTDVHKILIKADEHTLTISLEDKDLNFYYIPKHHELLLAIAADKGIFVTRN